VPIELFNSKGAKLTSISLNTLLSYNVDKEHISNCVVGTFARDNTSSRVCVQRSNNKRFRRTGVSN
jgi:hypothetical protein